MTLVIERAITSTPVPVTKYFKNESVIQSAYSVAFSMNFDGSFGLPVDIQLIILNDFNLRKLTFVNDSLILRENLC